MRFSFSRRDKIVFYWKYFISKTLYLWFEVRRPRVRMFLYEMLYSSMKFINPQSLMPSPFSTNYIETRYGGFRIRPRTADMATVSPAFERMDMDYLMSLIKRLRGEEKGILFLDVGASIGSFAVAVGNCLRDYGKSLVMSFEPARSSFELLRENIDINGLEGRVEPYNFALFSQDDLQLEFQFNSEAPGSSGLVLSGEGTEKVTTKRLDTVMGDRLGNYDAVVFKIDVEGAEADVLDGAREVLSSGKEIYFLVEDFVKPSIVRYLEDMGASFTAKLTPYNSWWRYSRKV
jgi:FkbM family methyltransferase